MEINSPELRLDKQGKRAMGPPGEALLTWPDSDGSMPHSRGKGSPELLFLWEKDKTD